MGRIMTLTATESAFVEHFRACIRERRQRVTQQRLTIALQFFRAGAHVSIDEVYQRVRERDRSVGYATVYRTLRLLAECGLASTREFGEGCARFEVRAERAEHDHIICVRCRQVTEFRDPELEARKVEIAAQHGFRLERERLEIYGVCARCQQAEAAAANPAPKSRGSARP